MIDAIFLPGATDLTVTEEWFECLPLRTEPERRIPGDVIVACEGKNTVDFVVGMTTGCLDDVTEEMLRSDLTEWRVEYDARNRGCELCPPPTYIKVFPSTAELYDCMVSHSVRPSPYADGLKTKRVLLNVCSLRI